MDNTSKLEEGQFEDLIQGLINDNFGCCNDFLLPETVLGLLANIEKLTALGQMKPSGIGNKQAFQQDKTVRGDHINWINEDSTNEHEVLYLNKVKHLILYLNTTCFTSINNFESHYASYEKKSVYRRHLDQFKSDNGRKFSIVLYLNQDWGDQDGGLLSLYPSDKDQVDIAPLGGRLVLFRSDEMEHEVHASFTRSRNSIAGWMKH